MSDLTRNRVPLTMLHPSLGPGWTTLFTRDGSTDETVIEECMVHDVYRLRGLDCSEWAASHGDVGVNGQPGRSVIDLGANIGAVAGTCLQMGAAHVIAVEPDPGNLDLLRTNLAKWPTRVTIVPYAVGDRGGGGEVRLIGDAGTAHTEYAVDAVEDGGSWVREFTLEQVIELVTVEPIALLKCDIEGGEFDTIGNCPTDVLARVERFVIEWHGPEECPWVERQRIGELVQNLQHTHSCTVIGVPERGGYLYAHRNDL